MLRVKNQWDVEPLIKAWFREKQTKRELQRHHVVNSVTDQQADGEAKSRYQQISLPFQSLLESNNARWCVSYKTEQLYSPSEKTFVAPEQLFNNIKWKTPRYRCQLLLWIILEMNYKETECMRCSMAYTEVSELHRSCFWLASWCCGKTRHKQIRCYHNTLSWGLKMYTEKNPAEFSMFIQ